MKICCYATESNRGFDLLKSTYIDIKVLPKVCEWNWYFYPKWRGFAKYLEDVPSDELVMIVDAYDVLLLNYQDVSQIEHVAREVLGTKDITFNAEKGCYPVGELRDQYPVSGSPWNYLNAGCAVGTAASWKKHLNVVLNMMWDAMDQEVWTRYFLANQNVIGLDYECRLFQSYAFIGSDEYQYNESGPMNKWTGTSPIVWHGNGKTPMSELHKYTMSDINQVVSFWKDDQDTHKFLGETFYRKTNSIMKFKEHRDFVESNNFGFGERAFMWMHKLLVDEMPTHFTFVEIGVYKGAILSAYKMIADLAGKSVTRIGVSPMSSEGGYNESDYGADVRTIHDKFDIKQDYTIVKGFSNDPEILASMAGASYDILLVDGGHDYPTVMSDLLHYCPMINPGGFLVVDDSANDMDLPSGYFGGHPEVTMALNDFDPSKHGFEFLFNIGHDKVFQKVTARQKTRGEVWLSNES